MISDNSLTKKYYVAMTDNLRGGLDECCYYYYVLLSMATAGATSGSAVSNNDVITDTLKSPVGPSKHQLISLSNLDHIYNDCSNY